MSNVGSGTVRVCKQWSGVSDGRAGQVQRFLYAEGAFAKERRTAKRFIRSAPGPREN